MNEPAKASKKDGQDDGFSVTSTSEENEEADDIFNFVGILAERQVGGATMYLVEWEDYPLSKATWEPREHFDPGTFSKWGEFKKESGRRTAPDFKIADWKKAIHDEVTLKRTRHEARNAKRISQGRQPTAFRNFGADYLEVIEESLEDFEEPDNEMTVPPESVSCNRLKTAGSASAWFLRQTNTSGSDAANKSATQAKCRARTILDAVSDINKEPKMLKLRHQNIVQKRLRDREGLVAPALPPNRLVALGNSTSSLVRSNSTAGLGLDTVANADDDDDLWDDRESSDLEMTTDLPQNPKPADAVPTQPGTESLDPSENQTVENKKKRKRSVRWDDTVTVVEVSDAREEDLLFGQDPLLRETVQSSGCPKGPETQSISIPCQIGAGEADLTILTFSGLPGHQSLPWLQHFSNQTRMIFTHTCTARDFGTQTELQERHLCRGFISNATGEERFEKIARRLRSGLLGLLCHNGEYCVFVFPAEGEGEPCEPKKDTGVSPGCLLNYSVIRPSVFLEPSMLAPLTCANSRVGSEAGPMRDVPVFDMFFELEYDQLLPPSARRENRHNFFLAFPPSARQETNLISQWLRYFDADCNIKSSLHPGSWSSFLKYDHGTLILHEDAIWAVRLFPNFANLLRAPSGTFKFFLFKGADPLPHVPPSRDSLCLSSGASKQLSPIFRPGTAFLVTPSFLLSQPEQAYVFVKWFWQNYSRSSQTYRRGKLVVFSDIEEWTLHLALETWRKNDERRGTDEEMHRHGSSPRSAEMGFKTWSLLRSLVADSTDEDDGLVVFAPNTINGSDEQSLVNWFGWWAIINMDQFRKFSVIGSSNQHPSRLAVCVPLPNYHEAATTASQAAPGKQTDLAIHQNQGSAWQVVYNDSGVTLAHYINQVEEAIRSEGFRPLALFKSAVSYWDPDMAFHFKDYTSASKSFRRWLAVFAENMNVEESRWGSRGIVNSYAGFFYTIEGAWDRAMYPQGVKPTRRPWVAILRPTNPHWRPWSATELFIWDCKAWAQYPGDSAVHLKDLICAQRELIKLIQEESQTTFELPLQRVWLGGSTADCDGDRFSEPLDIVLNWLANLPRNIKDLVPAPENKIPERNWKVVHPGQALGKPADSTAPSPMDVDSPGSEVAGPKSMIFHPPRVDGETRRSECRNRLYNWAERMRKLSKSDSMAEFTFEPTMRWYNEQVQKGQGLHHLDVSPWKATFTRHKIPDPKDVPDQG
ncbi:hypothetical protein HRG_000941 [Hirsutella rhossiliensis]|uniref:Chromatin binding protein n=1 Tax=Hirsutella rhossiliensis TaxID=111463 RepID=A0A9P8SNE3_9HYPO|nr:putative chromatin binding protein [Hirsutella rhossiliensis]KAH0968299.1 putative chromatin binding protein [Hirsutella rhossiliensis]